MWKGQILITKCTENHLELIFIKFFGLPIAWPLLHSPTRSVFLKLQATVCTLKHIWSPKLPAKDSRLSQVRLRNLYFTASFPFKRTVNVLYVQVTVHRDNLRINNQQDASSIQNFILSRNSTCFGHLLCPSSGVISCTRGNWYVSCRLCGCCLGESGWNCILTLLCSGHITCMKHTNCHVYSW